MAKAQSYITVWDPASFSEVEAPQVVDTSGLVIQGMKTNEGLGSSLQIKEGLATVFDAAAKLFTKGPSMAMDPMLVSLSEV